MDEVISLNYREPKKKMPVPGFWTLVASCKCQHCEILRAQERGSDPVPQAQSLDDFFAFDN